MQTMKKFFKYFINFIVLFLLVSGLMYLGTMNKNNNEDKKIEYIVQDTSPVIEITEYTNKGILTGTITNDTNLLINLIYVKAEFYDKNDNLLETKYSEIKYFNVGEKAKFEIEYSNKDVAKVKLESVEKQ